MMIKISDHLHVAAEDISEVIVNYRADAVTVRMKTGVGHHAPNDYGKSVWDTQARLVKEINAARTQTSRPAREWGDIVHD